MLVSRKWLGDYLKLSADGEPLSTEEITRRLTMSGLNHESTHAVGDDECIDLEVTSNRSDCLGHVGVAREISVLFQLELNQPNPQPISTGPSIDQQFKLQVEVPDRCPRYTARLIRGVRVGPSPVWLRERLETIGVAPVNNVVDITNYVMFECGQPLHAFDFVKLAGQQIVVRAPRSGEKMVAIDHKTYELRPEMCIIADAEKAVAIAGVMGGAESEVTDATQDVLIESALFQPLTVRNTARSLNLHSSSSYRFERHLDPRGVDWASRRCCELILKLAGGRLQDGCCQAGHPPANPEPIRFRPQRIYQVLGIDLPHDFSKRTLLSLGLTLTDEQADVWTFTPPSWRPDLYREIDLIEEVGRLYGYDHIPDQVAVPMAASYRTMRHRIATRVRQVMCANGFDEAMTPSLVPDVWSRTFSPWTHQPALTSNQPLLGVLEKASQNLGAVNQARRSLVPSLLEAKRINEYRANIDVELFEIAKVYLPQPGQLPAEPWMLGLVSSRSFEETKGVVEELLRGLNPDLQLIVEPCDCELLDLNRSAILKLQGEILGYLGLVSTAGRKSFGLRQAAVVAELNLAGLEAAAVLVPRQRAISEYPAVSRDFNFVMNDEIPWAELHRCIRLAAGPWCESVQYRETFRDPQKDGADFKRVLLTVQWRSASGTLTTAQVEEAAQVIIRSALGELQARLLA